MQGNNAMSKPSPLINIAAVAVIVASLAAVGAIMGIIPSAHSDKQEMERTADVQKSPAGDAKAAAQAAEGKVPQQQQPPQQGAATCPQCGVIESVRAVEVQGEGTGLGAVAGGVTGAVVGSQFGNGNGRTALGILGAAGGAYAGHTIEKNVRKRTSYRITVRMDDGTARTVYQSVPPGYGVGDKVKVINGALASRG